MKTAFIGESPADEATLKVLVDGLLGIRTIVEDITFLSRSRSWDSAMRLVPLAIKHLYYQSDVEGLVVLVDSDLSPIHTADHEIDGQADPKCRFCVIRNSVNFTLNGLSRNPARIPFRVAIGMAVPAIEAWYRCGQDDRVCEAIWHRVMRDKERTYTTNSLKKDCYGFERASLEQKIEYINDNADRLVKIIPKLEQLFPGGFGTMARDIRGWLTQQP